MKVILLFTLATYSLVAESAVQSKLAKRDAVDCNSESLPEGCRGLTEAILFDRALSNSAEFIGDYCSDTCAGPLYEYFRACDRQYSFENATLLDFLCSSNTAGTECLTSIIADDEFFSPCEDENLDEGTCSDECTTALEAASAPDSLGCCAYSYRAVSAGPLSVEAFYNFCGVDSELCDGGITQEPLEFFVPRDEVNIDEQCEDALVEHVPESCYYLLTGDLEGIFGFVAPFCESKCAPYIYNFSSSCDDITGYNNARFLDLVCAENSENQVCGELLFENFVNNNGGLLEPCENIDNGCSEACRDALSQAQTTLGCCLITFLQVHSGEDSKYLFTACSLDAGDSCIGHFSDRPIFPPPEEDECSSLRNNVPEQCQRYTTLDDLLSAAYVDKDNFKDNFCDTPCGASVYNFFVGCDRISGSNEAATVDFLCANNNGRTCAGIYSDSALDEVFEDSCTNVSDTSCPDRCRDALLEPTEKWGCCLFTLTALNDNVSFVEGIVAECKLPGDPHLCIGAFSNQPVSADPRDETPTCDMLRKEIPRGCDLVTPSVINHLANTDTDSFLSDFCDSDCAKPVYNYLRECVDETVAANTDFLCSSDRDGTDCVEILTDETIDKTFDGGVCDGLDEDIMCSSDCRVAFQGLNKDWGCCLYTFSALKTNVTYTDDVWSQCGADIPGLCNGELSGKPIAAPGSGDIDSPSPSNDGTANKVITSTLLLFCALALVLGL